MLQSTRSKKWDKSTAGDGMARFVRFVTAMITCLVCTPAAPTQSRVDALGDPLAKGAIARLGTTRMRHFSTQDHYCSGVGCVAWSPDGKMIATTSYFYPYQ